MKISLLLFFINSILVCRAVQELRSVLDTSGNIVKTGQSYSIVPTISSSKTGVLTLATAENTSFSCQVQVDATPSQQVGKGIPLSLSPIISDANGLVRVATDLNIQLSTPSPICPMSTFWTGGANNSGNVLTIGAFGTPEPQSFKIQRGANQDYYLQYCAPLCRNTALCKISCNNVTMVHRDKKIYLGIGPDVPVRIAFARVDK